MSTFTVTPSSLQALSGTLADVYGELEVIQEVAPQFGASLGGAQLGSALTDFCTEWSYGIDVLGKSLAGAVKNVYAAGELYAETEEGVCVAATPGS